MAIFQFTQGVDQCVHYGLSTDTKPAGEANGHVFLETDTGRLYNVEGGAWVEKISGIYAGTAHTHEGGSDPWTYVVLGSDFNTSNSTATVIPNFFFAPAINQNYEMEGKFLVRTVTATVAPRIGVRWATAMVAAVVGLRVTSAAGTEVLQFGNGSAAVLTPVGGLPVANIPYPASMDGAIITNGNVTGSVTIMLASEGAGTQVRMLKGSFLKYRTY